MGPTPGASSDRPDPGDLPLFDVEGGEGPIVVRFRVGRLEGGAMIAALEARLDELSGRLGPGARVVVNLRGLGFIESAALGVILGFWKHVTVSLGGAFAFCEPEPWVAEVFRLPGRSPFTMVSTEAEALAAVGADRDRGA